MVRRVRGHLRRKYYTREIEVVTTGLQVGNRSRRAIQFFHGGRCRLGRPIQVSSASEEEVEEGRWPSATRGQRRGLSCGDEQPISRLERFGLAIERDLGRS